MTRTNHPLFLLSRRSFLAASGAGAAVLVAPGRLLAGAPVRGKHPAFNTANLVARVTGYRYSPSSWMGRR